MLEVIENRLVSSQELATADSIRLFHGRGGRYPGFEHIVVDLFSPAVVVTLFKEPGAEWEAAFLRPLVALAERLGLTSCYVQRRDLPRSPGEWVYGGEPDAWVARRGRQKFGLSLTKGQNIGYFLDMEPGRQWLEQHVEGKHVLNLFAYTCAFSVVAVGAGAEAVVNVDMSRPALTRGRENHRMNGQDVGRITFLGMDILKSWGRIRRAGPYDVVIMDPPSFQKGFVATKHYRHLARRLPELLPEGGQVLVCLNAPELGSDFLKETLATECPQAEFMERLAPSPDFPDVDANRQLKLLHFSVRGCKSAKI